jgi:hypothetical protein
LRAATDPQQVLNHLEKALSGNDVVVRIKKSALVSDESRRRSVALSAAEYERDRHILKQLSLALAALRGTLHSVHASVGTSMLVLDLSLHPADDAQLHPVERDHPPDQGTTCFAHHGFCFCAEGQLAGTDATSRAAWRFIEGGHFEQTVHKARLPSGPGKQVHAVGVRVSIDKLVRLLHSTFRELPPACAPFDVMVLASTQQHTLVLTLASALRSCGYRVCTNINELVFGRLRGYSKDAEEVARVCVMCRVPFLVRVCDRPSDAPGVTVRHVLRDGSDEVAVSGAEQLQEVLAALSGRTRLRPAQDEGSKRPAVAAAGGKDSRAASKTKALIESKTAHLRGVDFHTIVCDTLSILDLKDVVSCVS